MSDVPEWIPRRLDAAHEQIQALGNDISGLRAIHEAHDRRLTAVEQRIAEDHGILVDLKITVHALSASVAALSGGISGIRNGQDDLHNLIRTHASEETLHIESIARRIVRVGAIGVALLICALVVLRVVPSSGLPGLLSLFGGGQ